MNKEIKEVLSYIKWELYFNSIIFYKEIRQCKRRNNIFIFAIPLHGNLGDQAIAYSEKKLLKRYLTQRNIVELFTSTHTRWIKKYKLLIPKNTPIFIHGGGFLGTLWPAGDKLTQKIITAFSDHPIIILPQTIYYDNSECGKMELEKAIEIYKKHPNLTIYAREKKSFDFMKKHFNFCKLRLTPDIVLSLPPFKTEHNERQGILLCLRSDHERLSDDGLEKEIIKTANQFVNEVKMYDTVLTHNVMPEYREQFLSDIWREFSHSRLIITNRLHGMIFSVLTNTPCIVMDNISNKIFEVYKWIENSSNVLLLKDSSQLPSLIEQALNLDIRRSTYNFEDYFKTIIDDYMKYEQGLA